MANEQLEKLKHQKYVAEKKLTAAKHREKQLQHLHHEALGRFDEPKSWEIREINEIMNQSVTGWIPYPNPRSYKKYGKQRGWMRGNETVETGTSPLDGFRELTEEECSQMELPF